jgi:hypothetical protein
MNECLTSHNSMLQASLLLNLNVTLDDVIGIKAILSDMYD